MDTELLSNESIPGDGQWGGEMNRPKVLIGPALQRVLKRHNDLSYEQLAARFKARGITDPNGLPILKGRIAKFASTGDSARPAPEWFIEAVAVLLELPQGWEHDGKETMRQSEHDPRTRNTAGKLLDFVAVPLVPSVLGGSGLREILTDISGWAEKIKVPDFVLNEPICMRVKVDLLAPAVMPGDVLVFEANASVKIGKIFAVTEKDTGLGSCMKVIYDASQRKTMLRTWEGEDKPYDEYHLDALLIAILPQYVEGRLQIKGADDEGLDISEWL